MTLVAAGARIETLALRLWTAPVRSCSNSSRLLRFPCHRDRLSQSRSEPRDGIGGLDEVGPDGGEDRERRDVDEGQ